MENGAVKKGKMDTVSKEDAYDLAANIAKKVPQDEFLTLFTHVATFDGDPESAQAKAFSGAMNSVARKRWPDMRG